LQWDYYGVIVNPTERNGHYKTTKPIRGVKNLRAWFLQKTDGWGFLVGSNSLQVSKICVQIFNKTAEEKHTHGSARFMGRIRVTDRDAFMKSFKQGIGRAKGFGLLQVVSIQK
jgi:CRISPR system Cascade subunit CasE